MRSFVGSCLIASVSWSFASGFAFSLLAGTDASAQKLVGVPYCNFSRNWDKSWGTPLVGEYNGTNTNVLEYHADILSAAGVDFVFPDWANQTPLHPQSDCFVFRTGQNFQSESVYSDSPWKTEDLYAVSGDFNNDGLDDAGHWSATSGKWRFFYAPGFSYSTGWGNYNDWSSATGSVYRPFAGDFNEDGKIDLGLRNSQTGEWRIRLNTGTTWSSTETVVSRSAGDHFQPYAGDFNGDGEWDIGMRNVDNGRFFFWSGPTYSQSSYDWHSGTGYQAFAGDINGDGTFDIGLRNSSNGTIAVKYGPAFSSEDLWTWGKIGDYWTPISGDWDQDGKMDIGLHNRSPYFGHLKAVEDNTFVMLDTWSSMTNSPKISIMLGIRDVNHLPDGRFQAKVDYLYDSVIQNPAYSSLIQHFDGKPLLLVWTRCPTLFPGGVPNWTDDRFTVRFGTAYLQNAANGDLTISDPHQLSNELGDEPLALYGHWSWEQREVRAYSVDDQERPECMTVQIAYREGEGLAAHPNTAGVFFEETWRKAFNVDPQIVLIPSFNEWTTNEHPYAEIARDIEPSVEFGTLFMDTLAEESAWFKAYRSDLLFRDITSGNWTMLNNPDFWYANEFQWAGGSQYQAVSGNFLDNGWGEIGLRNSLTGTFFIRSNGSNFSESSQITVPWSMRTGTVYQAVAGDINEDGISDPGVRNTTDGKWYFRESNGAGSWSSVETVIDRAGGSSYQPYTGDFNGDGEWDIGMRNPDSGRFFFWRGPFYGQSSCDWLAGTNYQAFAGDFNADGIWDIGLRDAGTGDVLIRPAISAGGIDFGGQILVVGPSGSQYEVLTGDIR